MQMDHIVFVEDDEELSGLIQTFLEKHEMKVTVLSTGLGAVEQIMQLNPDLVLLDIMLPDQDGISICKQLRGQFFKPIILFTANDSDSKQIQGFETGASDYVVKTAPPSVLLARIQNQLRLVRDFANLGLDQQKQNDVIEVGQLYIDLPSRKVTAFGEQIHLSTTEFELLALLAKDAGNILSRDHLLQEIRSIGYDGLDRSIDIAISRLRRKFKDNTEEPTKIVTIRNKGYLLAPAAWG